MSSARKQVKMISLGEITTPNIMKTIQAYTALIAEKKRAASDQMTEINESEIIQSISDVIKNNMELINQFKLGKLDETDFTKKMIDLLKEKTGIELTVGEFDQAWNAMNPEFKQFESSLNQAIEYNKLPNQQVIFISFTNPKDIRHLENELKRNNINYKMDNDQLVEIAGIQLFTTYATKQTKAQLIETTIKRLNEKPTQSTLAGSLSNIFSPEQAQRLRPMDIKYIRCVNGIKDPILKNDLDETNKEIEKTATKFLVDTILWKKDEKSFHDALFNPQMESKPISVARL